MNSNLTKVLQPSPREELSQFIEAIARDANVDVTTWRGPMDSGRLTGAFALNDESAGRVSFVWPFEVSASDYLKGPVFVADYLYGVLRVGMERACSGVAI